MKIAIAGATGFVGSRLVEKLQELGHEVVIFTRQAAAQSKFPKAQVITYNPDESGAWQQAISGCDGVVNLAGEAIAEERWTPEQKAKILNSRTITTEKIVEAIAKAESKPSVLINASAIGYYGTSETATFDENSPPGQDFLSEVCQAWETAAQGVKNTGTRLVILRTGIVLAMGGAIAKMVLPFQLFAGGPIGTGQQWFSWIHRDDLVNFIIFALTHPEVEGVFNGTAPNPVRMNELAQTMGQVLTRPSWLPVPGFALEMLLGEGAKVVLEGQQVLPKNTLNTGFSYQYPQLKPALEEFLHS